MIVNAGVCSPRTVHTQSYRLWIRSTRIHRLALARRKRSIHCTAQSSNSPQEKIFQAAVEEYAEGVKAGNDPEQIVRKQLGLKVKGDLAEVEMQYVQKAKAKIEERLREIEKEKKLPAFRFGEIAYGSGEYAKAELAFQIAVKDAGPQTAAGGEASLWLALCFQAQGKEEECLELYKDLKETHMLSSIRKRASELLFIMEAPKLKLREDERVKIPVLKNLEPNTGRRGYGTRSGGAATKKERKQTWEDEFWNNYEPPNYIQNKYFWIASSVVTIVLLSYSVSLKLGPD